MKGELVTGMSKFATRALSLLSLTFLFVATAGAAPSAPSPKKQTPNILFFILDDVGIDQMKAFGYGGATAPQTPNIDGVARAGVRQYVGDARMLAESLGGLHRSLAAAHERAGRRQQHGARELAGVALRGHRAKAAEVERQPLRKRDVR